MLKRKLQPISVSGEASRLNPREPPAGILSAAKTVTCTCMHWHSLTAAKTPFSFAGSRLRTSAGFLSHQPLRTEISDAGIGAKQ